MYSNIYQDLETLKEIYNSKLLTTYKNHNNDIFKMDDDDDLSVVLQSRHPAGGCWPTASPPPARRRAGRPLGRPTLDAPSRPYVPRQRPVGRVEGVGSRGLKGRGREDGGSTRAQGLGGAEGTHRSIHSDCPCPSPRPDLARGCFPPSVFSLPQVVCTIA